MPWSDWKKFGNPYLQYNEETGYIQAQNTIGEWVNIYQTDTFPIKAQIILCKQGDVANVPIDYKYPLEYGDEAYLANNGTAKLNSDGSVYCNKANNNYGCCAFGSKNLIDLTPFSKITFKSDRYSCTIDISTLTGNYYVAGGQIKGGYFTANNQAQFGVQVRTAKSGGTVAKGALSDVFTGTRDCTVTEFIIS